MKRTTYLIRVFTLLCALALATMGTGCPGSSSGGGGGDGTGDVGDLSLADAIGDGEGTDTAVEDVSEEAVEDIGEETVEDVTVDVADETIEDTGGDVIEDTGGDVIEDTGGDDAADTALPICDEVAEAADNAGTAEAPANMETVTGETFHACGLDYVDVFSVSATQGDVLNFILRTIGASDPTREGIDDLDMVLFFGAVSTDFNDAVDFAASDDPTEVISHTAEEDGTYFLIVFGYEDSEADYTLDYWGAEGCNLDADCSAGFCHPYLDLELGFVIQICEPWSLPDPLCGQGTAEDAVDNHGDSTSITFANADADEDGVFSGDGCEGDIDVFSIDVSENGSTFLSAIRVGTMLNDTMMTLIIVGPDGDVVEADAVGKSSTSTVTETVIQLPYLTDIGTYYAYLEAFPLGDGAIGTLDYEFEMLVAEPCRLDTDCTDSVCLLDTPLYGLTQACMPYQADECRETEQDDDNSFTNATALVSGAATLNEAGVCHGGGDFYKIEVGSTPVLNDITVDLVWDTAGVDLDVYLFDPTGSRMGAGWWGSDHEVIEAHSVLEGTYYIYVRVFTYASDDGTGTAEIDYTITATVAEGTACAGAADCVQGGTDTNDPDYEWACHSDDDGSCRRPAPTQLFDQTPGSACFEGMDCLGGVCLSETCTTTCYDEGEAECDAHFTADDDAYCYMEVTESGPLAICLPHCDATPNGNIWTSEDCADIFVGGSCDGTTHECTVE